MDKTILYINDEYCLTLEQLKGYFARELKPDTRLYDELLTLQRDGMLADWLQQGSDEEQTLAAKVAELSPALTNSQLMDELIRTFTGHKGCIDKPHPSTYLELKGVKCMAKDGQAVELKMKVEGSVRLLTGDVELLKETDTVRTVDLALSFKVKRKDNERFTLRMMSSDERMLRSYTLSPQGHRVGSMIVVEFNDLAISKPGADYLFTVDGETWATLSLKTILKKEYVDMGLPSGTLWATCNVGASAPDEYGDYFAWGETEPKEVYDWNTYKWCNGSENSMTKYCTDYHGFVDNKTELDSEDDAATVNWGPSWRTPTTMQQQELYEQCTWTWTTRNGVNGYQVTGPNGTTIFLPAAGFCWDIFLYFHGMLGYYWSSTLYSGNPSKAYSLDFTSSEVHWNDYIDRSSGLAVRAVRVSQN